MTLNEARAPFVKSEASVASMMRDVLFALAMLLVLPAVHYGPRPLVMAGVTMLACAVCEIAFSLIQTKSISLSDGSSLVTGMMITMLMPLNAPLWLPCAAAAFAILVAKMPFGSIGHTPFNPAASGVAFAVLCWPKEMFSYFDPATAQTIPPYQDFTAVLARSPAAVLKSGLKPGILPLDMLWGVFPGPLGTTGILVICACGLFLFLKRTARWEITVSFLAVAVLIAAFFPRIACDPLTSVKYELMSGSLLFCSVFMVTDPVTAPHRIPGRIFYGAFAGFLVMMFRRFGAFEQGAVFAVIIANPAAPQIDSLLLGALRLGDEPYDE